MNSKRHKNNSLGYSELDYKERVQSFNMAANKLREYVRVQLKRDATATRTAREIVESRIETLQKTVDAIRAMA